MEARKLVKSGYSSLVISLPKEWLAKNKLKSGDKVNFEEQNNNLILKKNYTEKKPVQTEKVIDIDGKSSQVIDAELISAYLNNYYYTIIKGKTLNSKVIYLKTRISQLIAFDVIEETSDKLVVKNYLNLYDSEIEKVIRRMDNIIRSMIIDSKVALRQPELIPAIMQRDKEVNKLNFLVSKILKAAQSDTDLFYMLGLSNQHMIEIWDVSMNLEKIGDHTKRAAKSSANLSPDQKKDFLQIINQLEKFYVDSMSAYYADSVKKTYDLAEESDHIASEISKFSSHKSIACATSSVHLFNLNNKINDMLRIVRYLTYN